MRNFVFFGIVPVIFLGTACGGKVAPSPETTMSGTVALTTYPSSPSAVVARDEAGHALRISLNANGDFTVKLPAAHEYRLTVVTANGEIPVVFPRKTGKLDTSFAVRSRGASIALGSVRHLPHAPASGFKVISSSEGSSAGESSCEDCADDDVEVSCQDGDQGQSGNQEGDQNGPDDQNEADGDDVDENNEMALADRNAPDDIDGCDDGGEDGETNDDGEQ